MILAVKGRRVRVRLVAERSVTAVVARSAALRTSRVGIPRRLVGPLPAGTVVGRIEVRENGRLEASVPLVTATRVPAPPPPSVLGWIIGGAVIGALLLGCSLPVMRRRVPRTATG